MTLQLTLASLVFAASHTCTQDLNNTPASARSSMSTISSDPLPFDDSLEHLVMLHGHSAGVGVWSKVMDQLLETLGDQFCVHALDLPGWGRSHAPAALHLGVLPLQLL